MKQEERIVVYASREYEGNWPPEKASDFLTWLTAELAKVPDEFKESSAVQISSWSDCDSGYAEIEIRYWRPETDDEETAREQREKAKAEAHRSRELQELARLQAKYSAHGGVPCADDRL